MGRAAQVIAGVKNNYARAERMGGFCSVQNIAHRARELLLRARAAIYPVGRMARERDVELLGLCADKPGLLLAHVDTAHKFDLHCAEPELGDSAHALERAALAGYWNAGRTEAHAAGWADKDYRCLPPK